MESRRTLCDPREARVRFGYIVPTLLYRPVYFGISGSYGGSSVGVSSVPGDCEVAEIRMWASTSVEINAYLPERGG